MTLRNVAAIGLGALLASCVYNAPVDSAPAISPLAANSEAPQLALLDRVLTDYFASDITNPPTICAGVTENGSTSALAAEQEVALIARHSTLAPFDRCVWNGQSYVDAVTEQPAMVFTIHSFACESDTRCSGWAGYTFGAASSISALYTMEFRSGRWSFTRDRRLIME